VVVVRAGAVGTVAVGPALDPPPPQAARAATATAAVAATATSPRRGAARALTASCISCPFTPGKG
jgi:hypothetical protein